MDEEQEHEENKVTNDTERTITEDSSDERHTSPISVHGNEKEAFPAEMVVSDHEEENSEEAPVQAVNSEPQENSGNELLDGSVPIWEGLDVKMSEDSEQPVSHEERVGLESSSNDKGLHRLHLETTTSAREDEEESTAASADKTDIRCEEHMPLLQELQEEGGKALQHSSQLQTKLAEYLSKKARDDASMEREVQVSAQHQEYEKCINILTDLSQHTETAQQQTEELRLQSQEKLNEVENEWQAFMSLKQDVAVTVFSQSLGKQAAQAKVESSLTAEQLQQDQLIKLKVRIHRLEAELRDEDEHVRDTLQLQFEKLQAQRLEQKIHIEKQNEASLKMQKKMSSSLELLSNVKEKLHWSQIEVVAKWKQLAEVEAIVVRKRDLLTMTKQACNSLKRDNQSLKERHGLLGNRVLLRNFEDTVDASDHLEEQLGNLKCRQTELTFSCGRLKKPQTT